MATALQTHNRAFHLDGREIRLFSGALHYFRVVPEYWRDRMLRMKACGLNAVETYVPWNLHEEIRGEFNFVGILDIRKFLQTAHEVGLYVLFRPGPYICAEWDLGGLPSWLLSDPNMKLRSPYQPYLDAVDKYFSRLLPLVNDLQYSQGGPIIAVQVENEYGSYGDDMEYKVFLKETLFRYGITELLYTSDNGMGIQRGEIPKVLITANFQEKEHGHLIFEYLKNLKQPDMPLMVMEFWTGWFDHWGSKHEIWPTEMFEDVLKWILQQDSSVNFYMIHGGTNFGFMNGANEDLGATNEGGGEPYAPDVTSYDYDAPISENGDLTPKFHKIKELLTTLVKPFVTFPIPDPPPPIPREAYGEVKVISHVTLKDLLSFIKPQQVKRPVSMEMLNINNGGGQGYGFILYQKKQLGQGHNLTFTGKVKDRAVVLLNDQQIDTVHWTSVDHQTVLPRLPTGGSTVDVLVENLGRVNYADYKSPILNEQRKGLCGDVLLDGQAVCDWAVYPLDLKKEFLEKVVGGNLWQNGVCSNSAPSLSRLDLNIVGKPKDTFINMKGWTKGVVFVNKFNLGRYWIIGPQWTLYIPAPLLKTGTNEILIFELHKAGEHVTFEDQHELGETVIHKTVIPEVALK